MKERNEIMKKIEIKVKGMVCEGCENRIQNALKKINGVENVEANHQTGIVTVTFKENLEENQIIEKIKELDFEVEE